MEAWPRRFWGRGKAGGGGGRWGGGGGGGGGGGDGGVAEEFLDDPDIGTVSQHVGGAGVAQNMGAHPIRQADPVGVLLHHAEGPDPGQPTTADVEEEGL